MRMVNKPFFLYLCNMLVLLYVQTYAQKPILCTYFTESHKELTYDFMLPSLQDDFEIIARQGEQVCLNASYYSTGWSETTLHKVQFIIDIIEQNPDRIIIFADPDILFFQAVEPFIQDALKKHDFAIQKDAPDKTLCSGFFALRSNEKTLQLWKAVEEYMKKKKSSCDQVGLNAFLSHRKNSFGISWTFLPTEHFCGGGTFRKSVWQPGKRAIIPENIAMFHANYAHYGFKKEYLTHVRSIVQQRKGIACQ